MCNYSLLSMVSSLAVIGLIRALSIDNQLMIVKNDCYERLAIGERLGSGNLFQTFNFTTLAECQKACTKEKSACKAFSFGISAKGNATCELSHILIKETVDLKPIGTEPDPDFDLYIKKLGCSIVTEKNPHEKPLDGVESNEDIPKPDTLGNIRPNDKYGTTFDNDYKKPTENGYLQSSFESDKPTYGTVSNYYLPVKPSGDKVDKVQTIVSVASGPDSYYHPVYDLFVSDKNQYGNANDKIDGPYGGGKPPFRPDSLHSLYDNERPTYRPLRPSYSPRPEKPNDGYNRPEYGRPEPNYNFQEYKPDCDIPDPPYGFRPDRPSGYDTTPLRPKPTLNGYDRPDPFFDTKPMNSRPSANDYNRPRPDFDSKPLGSRPKPDEYDRPNSNLKPTGFYESSYNHHSSAEHFYGSFGMSNTDRYDVRPERPSDMYPMRPSERPLRPNSGYEDKPYSNKYDNIRPPPNDYQNKPPKDYMFGPGGNDYNNRPNGPSFGQSNEDNPNYMYDRPTRPVQEPQGYLDNNKPSTGYNNGFYEYGKPSKPFSYEDNKKPATNKPPKGDYDKPSNGKPSYPVLPTGNTNGYGNNKDKTDGSGPKPIISHSIGYNGEHITSIITELKDACFRRVLAGKRVSRSFVRRSLLCETVEECQRECSDEKRFSCEGFNYRLDPTGRGKGECELLSVPLSHLDIGRDVYPDTNYDYYERDRNAASVNCKQYPSGGYGGSGGGYQYGGGYNSGYGGGGGGYYGNRPNYYGGGNRRPSYDSGLRRPGERWPEDNGYNKRPVRPEIDRRYDDYDYRPSGNRRGDYTYHSHHTQQDHFFQHNRNDDRRYSETHYLPEKPHKSDPLEPYLPPYYHQKDKDYWGLDHHRYGTFGDKYEGGKNHYYLPPKSEPANHWGLYGSSNHKDIYQYGTYGYKQSDSYWESNKYGHNTHWKPPSYLSGSEGDKVLPLRPFEPPGGNGYLPHKPLHDNFILPTEPREPYGYGFPRDECSLRMSTGFRLHKTVVKKYFIIPNIYECEMLCFREQDFPCNSYAFRYTINSATPTDNCYLSPKNYKELDNYIDLEPDRDFDIYTMNDRGRCRVPLIHARENSDCFWRVRSGQRLDHKVVRDSLTTKSIVDCQIECLTSIKFTCRSFSYRYGSPVIGGPIDNCQLTDWPYYELDPRKHFIPEPGFEIYERGSFGHGCEADHFGIRGHRRKFNSNTKTDQLCYIGFGSPARLKPQATIKLVNVPTELDCKRECTKAREETLFQCMSFSYRTSGPTSSTNCMLSDIYQRDLLPQIDYVYDPESWLFAWDNYNPECIAIANKPLHNNNIDYESRIIDRHDNPYALDTWRVYSVSGWPCRRGTLCKENKAAGFWYCELEGGDRNTWDYCCRPDHQCGASRGYQYQWCYVGPSRTQWRKCSDRYFPYIHNIVDRLDHIPTKPYLPLPTKPWIPSRPPYRPGARPDRPAAPPVQPPPKPSLDQYEAQFDEEFLEPPKPGGFGQPRHWPLSYLHKEMPPNTTNSDDKLMRMEMEPDENPKYAAIQNLINVIKKNDLNNIQYHISNDSNKENDILFVKIPLPSNFSQEIKEPKNSLANSTINLEPINLKTNDLYKRSKKSMSFVTNIHSENKQSENLEYPNHLPQYYPVYRKGFVTKTNVTSLTRVGF